MRSLKTLRVLPLVFATSSVLAQPADPVPTDRPTVRERGGRGEGTGRGPGLNPDAVVERMMERDKDGDGKLSREELSGSFGERIFTTGDRNGDGFVDKEELKGYFADMQRRLLEGRERNDGPGGGPDGGLGGMRGGGGFSGSMRTAGRILRELGGAKFDSAASERDIMRVQQLQSALLDAKADLQRVPMAPQAKEHYGDDQNAYQKDLRLSLIKAISESLALETAVTNGDAAAAQASVEKLTQLQKDGHSAFKGPSRGPGAGRRGAEGGAPPPPPRER